MYVHAPKLTKINIVYIHVLIVIFKGIEVFVLCVGRSVIVDSLHYSNYIIVFIV